MDSLLKKEYEKYIEFLKTPKFSDVKFTNPLLIDYDSEKHTGKDKIMILGQETFDWEGDFNTKFEDNLLEHLLKVYRDFYWGEGCFNSRRGAFWNEYRSLRDEYNKVNKETVFVWNNILKIGRVGAAGHLDDDIINTFIDYEIIQKELDIIKPKGLIFYTGPYYDWYIERVFKKIEIKEVAGFSRNELSIIEIESEGLTGFRTYHPGYLNRMGNEKKVEIRNKIIELMSSL